MSTLSRLGRCVWFVGMPALSVSSFSVLAQTPQTFTPKSVVQFAQGGDRERAMLARVPQLAPLVQGQFGVGAVDLDEDGRNEMVILSLNCDAAGCPVVVMQNTGGQTNFIFAQKMNGRLAVTNEIVNGYHAIAAADPAGAIMTDPTGGQVVYPLAAASSAPPAAAQNARVAATAPAAAAAPPAAARAAAPAPQTAEPLFGLPGHEYIPVCTAPSCLSPRVSAKSGVGTANAVVQGKVVEEDAVAFCARFQPNYRYCAEDELSRGGTAGGARFIQNDFRITANCEAGTMVAVDKRSYRLIGSWPEGGPGAGRPRFHGSMSESGEREWLQPNAGGITSGQTTAAQLALGPNSGESLAIQWELLCTGA